jgi:hypothetical protein
MTALRDWIAKAQGRGAVRIILRPDNSRDVLRSWEGDELKDPDAIEQEASWASEDEAKGRGGKRVYFRLVAFRKMAGVTGAPVEAASAEAAESHRFSQDTDNGGGEEGDSGGSQSAMIVRDLLRHTAEQNRTILARDLALMGAHERMTDKAIRRAEFLEGKYTEVLQILEVSASYEHERKISALEHQRMVQRDGYVAKQLETYGPIMMRYLLGGKGGKQAPIFQEEMLKQFFGTIKPEQMERLLTHLTEDQQAQVATLYMEFHGKAVEEEDKKAAASGSNGAAANGAAS